MWVIFPILCGVRWRIIKYDCRYKYILESLIDSESIALLLYHGPILTVNITVFCMLWICHSFSNKNRIIYTDNLFPQHLTRLSKFKMGLKCFNFIPNKLCRNNLCRKILLSSYDEGWVYSWESTSPVRHLTPVYPIGLWNGAFVSRDDIRIVAKRSNAL